MEDKKLFIEVYNRLKSQYRKLDMSGTLVYWNGEAVFNIEGYNLGYNIYRLGKLLDDMGEFE